MNINELLTFRKAAQLLNFSQTAKELNYSQSAVTIQIKNLEEEFGIQLFDRIGKNVRLTTDGKLLLDHACKIINAVEVAKETVGLIPSNNVLRVGCIDSICASQIPRIIELLQKKKYKFPIKVTISSPEKLLSMMDRNEIDLAYILDKPIHNKNWIKAFEKIEKLSFVAAKSSSLCKKDKLVIEDLMKKDFYLTEKKVNYRHALDTKLAELNLEVTPLLEVSNTDVILDAICQEDGVTFLPTFAFKDKLEKYQIQELNLENFNLTMRRQVFLHKNKYITEEITAFIGAIKELK